MMNANYKQRCSEVENNVKTLRENYLKNNSALNPDSLAELIIRIGYDSSCSRKLSPCDFCGESNQDSHYITEGCRMNGDAWGDKYLWCKNCGLTIHSRYDEY